MRLRNINLHLAIKLAALALLTVSPARADDANWPQWRGPNLNGSVEKATIPLTWSETENIAWKQPMPWWSGSTPIVWGDRIFIVSPEKRTPENENLVPKPEGAHHPGGPTLVLLCLKRSDGSTLWTREIGRSNELRMKQNMTSPSPVTDGQFVWVMTGNGDFFCFDFEGNQKWTRNIQKDYYPFGQMWGYGSSPLLYKDRIIVPVLHGFKTDDPSFLFAVDKLTGKTLWKTERPTDSIQEGPDSYASPQILHYADRDEVIINGGDIVTAHDPTTGAEVWRSWGLNPKKNEWYRIIASTLCVNGMVVAPTRKNPVLGIRGGGKGDVSKTHVAWTYKLGPDVPSPVSDGKSVWLLDDDGRFSCLDLMTGEPRYSPERLAQGTYSASLVLAGDRILAINEGGVTTVVAATPEFKILATNTLDDEYTLSSPVVCDGEVFLRTSTHLYCIADKTKRK